jgi:protein-S-isoprenylcysteine O-methyltransferase Ste14
MVNTTDHAQIPFPPPLIFLGYLLAALVLHWVVPFPTPWPMPLRVLGGLLVVAGLLLAGFAVSEMRKMRTSPDPQQPSSAIVTSGPYRITRNPIYLGFLLIYVGFTLLAGTIWGLLLSPFLFGTVTTWIIHAEERYLSEKFRDVCKDYSSRVRRWV